MSEYCQFQKKYRSKLKAENCKNRAFTLVKSGSRYLTGFTLTELLVTMAIVLIMSAVAIPAFNKYGNRSQFHQKGDEVAALMNQAFVSMQSPEKGVDRYVLQFSSDSVGLYQDDSIPSKLVKTVNLSSDEVLNRLGEDFLLCYRAQNYCCNTTVGSGAVSDCGSSADSYSGNIISISNSKVGETATFNLKSNPVRLNITY